MNRWITLSRNQPEFNSYIQGTFSSEHVAVPTRTLNALTSNEEVTFEIIPSKEVKRPNWFLVTLRLFRPLTLTLSLAPAVVSLAYLTTAAVPYSLFFATTTLLGTILFHGALNYLNDYYDHVRGEDRVSPNGGSRAIQRGWVRAITVKRVVFALLAVAIALGLPALIAHPSLAIVIAVIALIAGIEFSSKQIGLKYRGFGEILLFLLSGPLVSVGFSWAVAPLATPVNWGPIILIGSVFGAATVYVYHLKNIEDIFVDSQAGIRTLAVAQGFDRAKRFLWVLGAAILLAFIALGSATNRPVIILAFALLLGMNVFRVNRQVSKIASPLSSDMPQVRLLGIRIHWLIFILLLVAIV